MSNETGESGPSMRAENEARPPPDRRVHEAANPGIVVRFGEPCSRTIRVSSYEEAAEQAQKQRAGGEPLVFYDGRDFGAKLREGAVPGLVVKRDQSIKDAESARRRS